MLSSTLFQTNGRDTRTRPHWLLHSGERWGNNLFSHAKEEKRSRGFERHPGSLQCVCGTAKPSTADSYSTLEPIQMVNEMNTHDSSRISTHTCRQAPRVQTYALLQSTENAEYTCNIRGTDVWCWGLCPRAPAKHSLRYLPVLSSLLGCNT